MADKKKPNYADSLKGAARSVTSSSAAGDGEEVVYIDVGGEVLPYPRGKGANRLDDAAWERVKARAVPTESKDMKSKPLGWSDLMGLGQNLDGVADSVVSKEQKELLKKTDEWTRAEYLRQRFKAKGYEVPPNSADDERKSYKDGKRTTDTGVTQPDQGSPDEWKAPPEKATVIPSTVEMDNQKPMPSSAGRTEDDAMVGSADPGMSVRGQMARLATGAKGSGMVLPEMDMSSVGTRVMPEMDLTDAGQTAALQQAVRANEASHFMKEGLDFTTPESRLGAAVQQGLKSEPGYQQVTDNGDTTVSPTVTVSDSTVKPTVMVKPMKFGAGIVEPDGVAAPQPSMMDDAARFVGGLPQRIGSMIGGRPAPSTAPVLADPLDDTAPRAPLRTAPSAGGGAGTGMSASVSGRVPGKGGGTSAPKMSDAETMLMQGYETQKNADALLADIESRKLQSKADLIRQQQDEAAKLAARQSAMETARSERMKRGESGLATLQARLADLEGQSPDPNRFWNNKNAGQKAAAVIAGALFGYSGQGMQWLQRLDGLVESDIQQQAAELQRKSGLVGKQIDVQNNMVALARQQGLDEAESISAARAMMMQNYAMRFEQMAATTGSEAAKATALANAGILRQKVAAELGDMRLKTSKAANEAALTAAQIAHLNAQTFALGAKTSGGGKGSEGDRKLPPGTREEVAKLQKGLEALQQAREALAGGNRFTDQIANNLRSALSMVGLQDEGMFFTPDTTGRTAVAESAQETALKAVVGEALQETDIERNRPRFARPGLNAGNTKWIDSQEEILRAKLNALTRSKSEDDLVEMPSTRLTTERPAQ